MKTTISQNPNQVTISTLRERAAEFLRVADNLEAHEKFAHFSSNGPITARTGITTMGMTRRTLSKAARAKIAKATKARWAARKKGITAVAAKAA